MKKIQLLVFYQPGEAHLDSVRIRAERALENGLISALPEISAKEGQHIPFWNIVLEIPPQDAPFWLGFCDGVTFCNNNREITTGCGAISSEVKTQDS